jgi:glucosamine-6-phosphate deaminase
VFFELEEYVRVDKNDPRSNAYKLYECFFQYVDAEPSNVFFLNGAAVDIKEECELFEKAIQEKGGIQLLCAEVDSEAAIGGNAPGSSLHSRTRLKTCSSFMMHDRSFSRNGERDVAESWSSSNELGLNHVITMGLETIMEAEEVYALFIGGHVARALHRVLEETISNMYPASILQYHKHVNIVCDRSSACTLLYANVEYFVGLNQNYNLVNHIDSAPSLFGSVYGNVLTCRKFAQFSKCIP